MSTLENERSGKGVSLGVPLPVAAATVSDDSKEDDKSVTPKRR